MELAKKLIRFYGYEPDVNMPIKIVGLRPGEKLYEELLMDSEQMCIRDRRGRAAFARDGTMKEQKFEQPEDLCKNELDFVFF